jgi:hypothetical protein
VVVRAKDHPSSVKYDKSKAVWDDNYGWIMPKPQPKGEVGDWFTGALMTAAQLAAGMVGIPPLAMAAVNAAKGYGSGENLGRIALNTLPSVVGAGLNYSGVDLPQVPNGIAQAYKYGKMGYGAYNMYKKYSRGG